MRRLSGALLALMALAYPVAVYWSLDRIEPRWLALGLAGLWLLRARMRSRSVDGWCLPAVATLACLVLAVLNDAAGLRWYPVFMSAAMLGVFGFSLYEGPSVIERLARLREPDLDVQGQRYTRGVTLVWCVFFVGNGSIAAALALWAPWTLWTLYNGLLSYGLMGLLLAGEWLLRPHLRRRMEEKAAWAG